MRRDAEQGFALISALWLLLLGASIAALLMLRGTLTARELHAQRGLVDKELATENVVETIVADMMFAGQATRWGQLPANGSIKADGSEAFVEVTFEDDIADINKTDPARINGALQDKGFAAAERAALLDRIAAARAGGHMLASYAEVAALGRGIVPLGREDCLIKVLSPFGGAASAAMVLPGGRRVRAGDVLRIAIGRQVLALRLTATNDRPYGLLDDYLDACPDGAAA